VTLRLTLAFDRFIAAVPTGVLLPFYAGEERSNPTPAFRGVVGGRENR
jgi:hypothetical protein